MEDGAGRILIVDDDAEMRELVCDVLQDRGHTCSSAGSAREALRQLSQDEYAVILTDLRMKGMLGTELLAEVKREHPDIGVILMTAFGSVETAVDAMKQGASEYITKPFALEDLAAAVRGWHSGRLHGR